MYGVCIRREFKLMTSVSVKQHRAIRHDMVNRDLKDDETHSQLS